MVDASQFRTYVVNLRRRRERRQRMTAILPPELQVTFTSDWTVPIDGHEIDEAILSAGGYELFPWRIPSDNPWWSRALKLGEVGCTIAHWTCWQHALETGDEPFVLVFEDDAVLVHDFLAQLRSGLERLGERPYDIVYLGRCPDENDSETIVVPGIVSPGFSYDTVGYLLTRAALPKLLATELRKAIVPADEFLPCMYMDHPRPDLRARFPKRLTALAFEPPLVQQVPIQRSYSDTEDSDFVAW